MISLLIRNEIKIKMWYLNHGNHWKRLKKDKCASINIFTPCLNRFLHVTYNLVLQFNFEIAKNQTAFYYMCTLQMSWSVKLYCFCFHCSNYNSDTLLGDWIEYISAGVCLCASKRDVMIKGPDTVCVTLSSTLDCL